ncbi:uncharacterized protein LOC131650317 [Vicia villosa]|uniref:uncharacterized protein LOC131650317 n=1 Tax=Vicia villosa TaxID=3911 RepID=UPI00273CC222|nr:uncharacterized protein LOC131650317 [Vicia villosa]
MDYTQAQKIREFLRKYYPEDVPSKKEIELLELKQGNMSVIEYAAEFNELAKFYPYYDGAGAEFSKCIKFESRLRSEIKKADGKGKQNRSTPYDAPVGKGKAEVTNGKRTSGGGAPASVVCFKCGEPDHKSDVCTAGEKRCIRCGKIGPVTTDCMHKEVICFNFGEEGHFSSKCQKLEREPGSGKMFALAGTQTANEDRNVGGAYFISNTCNYHR